MTVEAVVFIALGLLCVGVMVKIAAGSSSKRNSDTNSPQTGEKKEVAPAKGNGNGNGNGNGQGKELEVGTVGKEKTPDDKDTAPTAELQTIDNIEAIQRVQILISKGQTIEAVQYLCDNAGYDKKRALALVESMGKKVYSSD